MVAALTGFPPASIGRLVIKIGSALLVDRDGRIRAEWLAGIASDIADRRAAGQQVIVVSSGAIALGARRLALAKGGRGSLDDAQAAAAVGQIALSQNWATLLGECGLTAAQMLLTLDDLENRRRYLNAAATLERLLSLGVIPIINENDSVATTEIRFGDNDRLAARIGQAARVDAVVLLSDVDGLYTANPHNHPDARLVNEVKRVDARVLAMADSGSGSGMGSGGMASKIEAAKIATGAGVHLAIISGKCDRPLLAWSNGANGTIFLAQDGKRARQNWLAGRQAIKGRIVIDAGAHAALLKGNSLLPAGVIHVSGQFARGDVVDIAGPDGEPVARGLAEYDAEDARRTVGKRKQEIATLLGPMIRPALVHRDHLVML